MSQLDDKTVLANCVGDRRIANILYEKFGNLNGIANANKLDLLKVPKVGVKMANRIQSIFDLAQRAVKEQTNKTVLDSPESIYELMKYTSFLQVEHFFCIPLDSRLGVIKIEELSRGTLNECSAHPRDVLKTALLSNAYGFVCVHNHPSGDPSPSRADREITKRIDQAANIMSVHLIDHVIIGKNISNSNYGGSNTPYFSFKEAGLI